ncbi:ABC transporter substrate-binding protein [Actinomadura barringtoniae]|uniref:ABC transporter substrate-binding protein n=1 Tax=Actinomadura barringtoniae TaxID=1427535 RepID=A0A939T359_9ACTN|nr:ABC transporter substrate-binding protein [Actinomadura barringtoniae]MBO2450651.1 ABC transporter substrate-binding protein [Actinomadura barringtoniae]
MRPPFKTRTLAAVALVPLLALSAVACGDSGKKTKSASGKELDKVTLTLNWYPYGEHAPFYYGKQKGIYEKHGIALDIKAGQGSQKTVQATAAGQTDFGWADTSALATGVGQGLPIKSIGVFLQTTPASVQAFSSKSIKAPADLKGKKIALTAGDALSKTFPVFLKKNGVADGDVKIQNTDPAGKMAVVLSGQVDGLVGFANDQGPTMQNKSGKPISYLRYSAFGLNYYSNGLVVGDKKLKSSQDLAKRMFAATSEAWAAAEQDQAGAVASMAGASQQLPPAPVLTDQFKTTLTLLHTDATKGKAPGINTAADWTQTVGVFAQSGLITKAESPDKYWANDLANQG